MKVLEQNESQSLITIMSNNSDGTFIYNKYIFNL